MIEQLLAPFTLFFTSSDRIYWLNLLSAFAIAFFLFISDKQRSSKAATSVWAYCFPKSIILHRSAVNDYLFFYADILFQSAVFGAFFSSLSVVVSYFVENSLNDWFPMLKGQWQNIEGMIFFNTLILAIFGDFALFLAHFLQHRIPWLWEFHKVHHSAEVMTPMTVFRIHPIDTVLVLSSGGLFIGAALGCMNFLLGQVAVSYNVYGVNVILILFYLLGYNLRHSHIWWSWGPFFSRIFISPAQHQIHHSAAPEHFDKNMGFTFAFWDGLFGTLYIPKKKEALHFGLGTEENEKFSTFWSLYFMPFIRLSRNFRFKMLLEPNRYLSIIVFLLIVFPAVYFSHYAIEPVQAAGNRLIENMTWLEVREAINSGSTTVLVPTGGTEQNGLHMILGKHNEIVKYTAAKIAESLGKTLVAPVISYVPEGNIDPPTGHMKFAGTLSISEAEFEAVLESTARSLQQHGFKMIAFIGDSGGNQAAQQRVAERLSQLWQKEGVIVLHVGNYYADNSQYTYLLNNGYSAAQIGTHAGIRDTSELMAVFPEGVRSALKVNYIATEFAAIGADGDAGKASVFLGNILLDLKIHAAVKQIRAALTG